MRDLPGFVRRRLDPAGRYGLRVTLFALAVVVVFVPFGILLDQVVREGPLARFDTLAANGLHEWVRRSPATIDVLRVVTFLGKPAWLAVVVGAACVFLAVRGLMRLVVYMVTTSVGGGLVDTAVKLAVNRPRPSVEHPVATAFGKSFPSGHSMSSTVVYGALLLVFLPVLSRGARRAAAAAAVALVGAIGVSRLGLGVHYITDVLGGFALGLAWLAASTAAFQIWRVERGRPAVDVLETGVEPEAAPRLRG